MTKHKHHIIPKHAGGTDDPSNLVKLTIEEHAEAHKALFEEYGRWQDELAWKTLSGQISRAEAIKFAQQNSDKSWCKDPEYRKLLSIRRKEQAKKFGVWNKGLTKEEHPGLQKLSESAKKQMTSGLYPTIGDRVRGKPKTAERREAERQRILNQSYITCQHCGKNAKNAMHKRWHGDNCRLKSII